MKRLNNKGYMLVEIILASALAFGIAWFMLDLIVKLKNKNDDLLVETLTATDQTIIANEIMKHVIGGDFTDCSSISISGNKFSYNGTDIMTLNEYAEFGDVECGIDGNNYKITIPIKVKQLSKKNFNVEIDYNRKSNS